MIGQVLILLSTVQAAGPPCPGVQVSDTSSVALALAASGLGLDLLSRGEPEEAIACLELAARTFEDSAPIARDLASAYAAVGKPEDALPWIDRAIALGDADPDARALRAMVLAALNRKDEAIQEARRSATWESDLIGAALGDEGAAYRVGDLVSEPTQRGALSALVLSAHAGDRGEQAAARLLDDVAQSNADVARAPIILNTARALGERLVEKGGVSAGARLRTSIDHTTNPSYLPSGNAIRDTGVRLAVLGEGTVQAPLGIARFDAALRVDQHVFITSREQYRDLDLTGLTLATSVELPISASPSAALVGLRARISDAWGKELKIHYATMIEGGPNLILPMTASTRLELGVYGLAIDYIDLSPPDSKISSVNRDHLGQRATLALSFRADWLDGRTEVMFLRDAALGDAFNALGGAAAGRLRAHPGGGIVLGTGVAVTVRQYGPVGDLSIIGPAATRTEIRTVVDLGAQIPISESGLSLVLGDVWIQNGARSGHAYTENVLSTGMEQVW